MDILRLIFFSPLIAIGVAFLLYLFGRTRSNEVLFWRFFVYILVSGTTTYKGR
jgi:hypothetical protein